MVCYDILYKQWCYLNERDTEYLRLPAELPPNHSYELTTGPENERDAEYLGVGLVALCKWLCDRVFSFPIIAPLTSQVFFKLFLTCTERAADCIWSSTTLKVAELVSVWAEEILESNGFSYRK